MLRGADWYKREPRTMLDAKRAAKMTALQAAIYDIVLDLIYEGAGETPNDPAYFAVHLSGVAADQAAAAVADLVAMGKLTVQGDKLSNPRARREAKSKKSLIDARRRAGKRGGKKSGEARRSLKDNEDQRSKSLKQKRSDKRREEESREDGISPDGDIPGAPGVDLLGDRVEDPDKKAPLDPKMPLPEDWMTTAIEKAGVTAEEAKDEWEISFCPYWSEKKGTKDGKKTRTGWKRAWLNYVTGDICQRRIRERRRNGSNRNGDRAAGDVEGLRKLVSQAAAKDAAR